MPRRRAWHRPPPQSRIERPSQGARNSAAAVVPHRSWVRQTAVIERPSAPPSVRSIDLVTFGLGPNPALTGSEGQSRERNRSRFHVFPSVEGLACPQTVLALCANTV